MIVGTAGHVDHGKTTLVKALTGVDTDRLKEEKARGITIDLGFAYLPRPDGSVLSFVDVPGHERFVHRMLTGAHGIDFVLLTVAANEGVKPQTREHLEILHLLGLRRGMVLLTKADLVDDDTLLEREIEIEEALLGTTLEGAEVLPVSAITDRGLDTLLSRLDAAATAGEPRDSTRLFRLAIDRAFVLSGAGTVVTGTVLDGRIAVGDRVVVTPSRLAARVRGIHVRNAAASVAVAGDRAAINLAGTDVGMETVHRGEMLLAEDNGFLTARIDADFAGPRLPSGTRVRLFHATTEVGAYVVPLRGGDDIQLVLEQPIAARWQDRFILRDVSHQRTLGGGRFLDVDPPRRHRSAEIRVAMRDAWRGSEPASVLLVLLNQPPYIVDVTVFRRVVGLPDTAIADLTETLGLAEIAVQDRTWAISRTRWTDWTRDWTTRLAAHHTEHPDEPGIPLPRFRAEAGIGMLATVAKAVLAATEGIVVDGPVVRLASHTAQQSPAEAALWERILPLISGEQRFRPPRTRDIAALLDVDEVFARVVLRGAKRFGWVEEPAHDHFFLKPTMAEMIAEAAEAAKATDDGWFNAAAFRDRLGNGRKVAIQILEFFDRRGITVRRGDLRRVDPRRLSEYD